MSTKLDRVQCFLSTFKSLDDDQVDAVLALAGRDPDAQVRDRLVLQVLGGGERFETPGARERLQERLVAMGVPKSAFAQRLPTDVVDFQASAPVDKLRTLFDGYRVAGCTDDGTPVGAFYARFDLSPAFKAVPLDRMARASVFKGAAAGKIDAVLAEVAKSEWCGDGQPAVAAVQKDGHTYAYLVTAEYERGGERYAYVRVLGDDVAMLAHFSYGAT